jgi:hypothetical protein
VVTEVRTDMCDFPTGWRIQDEIGTTSPPHDPKCSCVPGHHPLSGPALLCDCGAILREWRKRVKEQTGAESEHYTEYAVGPTSG